MIGAVAFGVRDKRSALRAAFVMVPLGAVFGLLAIVSPRVANISMMHVHNVIGIATWAWLYGRRKRWELAPVLLVLAAVVLALSGATFTFTRGAGGLSALGTPLEEIGAWLAPGAPSTVALRVALVFV